MKHIAHCVLNLSLAQIFIRPNGRSSVFVLYKIKVRKYFFSHFLVQIRLEQPMITHSTWMSNPRRSGSILANNWPHLKTYRQALKQIRMCMNFIFLHHCSSSRGELLLTAMSTRFSNSAVYQIKNLGFSLYFSLHSVLLTKLGVLKDGRFMKHSFQNYYFQQNNFLQFLRFYQRLTFIVLALIIILDLLYMLSC